MPTCVTVMSLLRPAQRVVCLVTGTCMHARPRHPIVHPRSRGFVLWAHVANPDPAWPELEDAGLAGFLANWPSEALLSPA